MNRIFDLKIDRNSCFEFWTEEDEPFDYFTGVIIYFIKGKERVIVFDDFIGESLTNLTGTLDLLLNYKCVLDFGLKKGKVGREYNVYTFNSLQMEIPTDKKVNDPFPNYWFWSAKRVQTWTYNIGDKIFFEISPSYPWLHLDPEPGEPFTSFEDFMKDYHTIADFELDRATALAWLESAKKLLGEVNTAQQAVEV
jgi:hypothetical protein